MYDMWQTVKHTSLRKLKSNPHPPDKLLYDGRNLLFRKNTAAGEMFGFAGSRVTPLLLDSSFTYTYRDPADIQSAKLVAQYNILRYTILAT
jgi:hypothetical protein